MKSKELKNLAKKIAEVERQVSKRKITEEEASNLLLKFTRGVSTTDLLAIDNYIIDEKLI